VKNNQNPITSLVLLVALAAAVVLFHGLERNGLLLIAQAVHNRFAVLTAAHIPPFAAWMALYAAFLLFLNGMVNKLFRLQFLTLALSLLIITLYGPAI
jgi:hypothetical protein